MFELVPSTYMKKVFEKNHFELSDFQKATIIWDMPGKSWKEKLEALRELSEITKDNSLKRQIEERIHYEKKKFDKFKDNSFGRYVYVVKAKGYPYGFFADYGMAIEYFTDLYGCGTFDFDERESLEISKQLIVRSVEELTEKTATRWNPNIFPDKKEPEYDEYDGNAVSEVYFDIHLQMTRIYSNEMSVEEDEVVNAWKKERFEESYFDMPYEGRIGMIVQYIFNPPFADDERKYGVVLCNTKSWMKYRRMVGYQDIIDLSVEVCYLTKAGMFSHEHINPIYLEPINELPPKSEDNTEKWESFWKTLISYSNYWKHEDIADNATKKKLEREVLENARNYAKICAEEEVDVNQIESIYDLTY